MPIGRKTALALAALWLAGSALPAAAASPWANVADPVFQRVDLTPIGSPAVYAVAQDAQGFLWIGTPVGLWRYDGYEFRGVAATRGAPPNVESLAADPRGSLWIGTQSSGLERLDEKTETFQTWPPDPQGRRGPRSATIIALARMQNGRWWIGGDSGLDAFDPATQTFTPVPVDVSGQATPRIEAIHVDSRQGVWVGTVRGLYYRPAGASRFRRLRLGANDRAAIFSLYENARGQMWAGSLNALYVVSAQGQVVRAYESSGEDSSLARGEQWAITEVTPGTYWIGTGDGGIAVLDAATQRFRRIVIDRRTRACSRRERSGSSFTIAPDWCGSPTPPADCLHTIPTTAASSSYRRTTRALAREISARVRWRARADGSLGLGGADKVLHLDPRTGVRRWYSLSGDPSVQALYDDAIGTLWIGTMRGLCRLSARASAVDCPGGAYEQLGRVFSIVRLGKTLWVGTDSGVSALNPDTGEITRFRHTARSESLSNDYVELLYAGYGGYVWAGTANGLNRIDPRSLRVTRLAYDPRDPNSLGSGQVIALTEDDRGRIWAGSVGGPMNVVAEHRGVFRIRRLGNDAGMPENVSALEAGADGFLWAGGSNLLRIDPHTLHVDVFGRAEGVQESEFWPRPSKAPDGTLFFPGAYSVTVVAPGASVAWKFTPPLVVTSMKIGRSIVPVRNGGEGSVVELPSNGRDLSVEFAALDYSAPAALRYDYRLDGYDRARVSTDASHRVATYTNLAPGDYTLHIGGSNRDGRWSANAIALKIRALPAWYETWWFRALLASLGMLAIFGFVRARTAVLRRRAEQLEDVVQERTAELAQANEALEKMTIVDPLTGLHNRRFLLQRIDEEVELAVRKETDLLFFLVDIDYFKAVNDGFGHAAGDRVLEQMRERLEEVFRASDFVLRWGGEEFLVVTRGSPRGDAPEIAERLRAAIERRPFALDGGQVLAKTASIGFAAFPFVRSAPYALQWMQIVDLADQALYMAKHGGRNAWCGLVASSDTDAAKLSKQLAISAEDALREARVTIVKGSSSALDSIRQASRRPAL